MYTNNYSFLRLPDLGDLLLWFRHLLKRYHFVSLTIFLIRVVVESFLKRFRTDVLWVVIIVVVLAGHELCWSRFVKILLISSWTLLALASQTFKTLPSFSKVLDRLLFEHLGVWNGKHDQNSFNNRPTVVENTTANGNHKKTSPAKDCFCKITAVLDLWV